MKITNPLGRTPLDGGSILPYGACWCNADDGYSLLYEWGWGSDDCHCSCRYGDDANMHSCKQNATAIK